MKNILIQLILFSILFNGCKENTKNDTIMNDDEFYSELSKKVMICYKSTSHEDFKKKILDIFNVDIDTTDSKKIFFEGIEAPVVIKDENYLIPSMYEATYGDYGYKLTKENIAPDFEKHVCKYNKMIFYNDMHATTWIKANRPNYIIELISKYGYTGNEDWLKFTFSKTDFTDVNKLDELLFGIKIFSSRRTESGEPKDFKEYLRKDMLEKMVEHKVEYSQFATLAHMTEKYPDRYIEDPDEIVARLYDATYRMGGYGLLEYLYDRKISYKETFKDHDYYGLEALRKYSETIYKPEHERGSTSGRAVRALCVINDPDGYTNVRKAPSSSGEILFRINEGEEFTVELENPAEEWWRVVSPKYGYIHKSRVKIIKKYGDW